MILLILGLVFIVLIVIGMPIRSPSASHRSSPRSAAGVDNATIVQRMLTRSTPSRCSPSSSSYSPAC